MREKEEEWATMMRQALSGDADAYRSFFDAVTPALRATARRNLSRYGATADDAEDVVQETLLALHLKRHTWDGCRPIGPWIAAIARNKLIDSLRKRRRHAETPIDELSDFLGAEEASDPLGPHELDRLLLKLNERQRDIVRSLSVQGASVRETARRLAMSEVAVRVSLHRALKAMADLYRGGTK
jgi:RNA polymerase sigma factor (sigma-70 family)